ncbi:hypothetical protein NKH60_19135 [Mesorhizobium sp. M1006]|uniref:hypothetical protein n=1 Tax=Mesorhizobium sp. M1006 TaxID=2957048 RepID=UPI003338BD75
MLRLIYPELIYRPFTAGLCRVLMMPSTWLVLFSTRVGVGLRAVDDNPAAVDRLAFRDLSALSCGIFTGVLTGMAGA